MTNRKPMTTGDRNTVDNLRRMFKAKYGRDCQLADETIREAHEMNALTDSDDRDQDTLEDMAAAE